MYGVELFDATTLKCSKLVTKNYSTSFTLGIRTLSGKFHNPVYAIYGFVRYADEIVDTFHNHDKKELLDRFSKDTFQAIEEGISLNPILHAFQQVVNKYHIEKELIEAFLHSMYMDLSLTKCDKMTYQEYIYGSAEVVGLMCLRVFCEGDKNLYDKLKAPARSLGSAFQKVNFLRDMKSDFEERGRIYFPGVEFQGFDENNKIDIEKDIENDFEEAYQGIKNLPKGARLGVYLAYVYYRRLFNKIKMSPVSQVVSERIRIPDKLKFALLVKSYVQYRFNFL